jgi:ketopantoate reductase
MIRHFKVSTLQDLEKGLTREVETINDYLSKMSDRAGFPTVVNDQVTEIVRKIQAGKLPYQYTNLDLITLPSVGACFV